MSLVGMFGGTPPPPTHGIGGEPVDFSLPGGGYIDTEVKRKQDFGKLKERMLQDGNDIAIILSSWMTSKD